MASSSAQSGMFLMVGGTVLAGFGQVAVQNHHAVEGDFNFGTLHIHFLGVPFTYGFEVATFGGNNPVGRAVVLVFFQILVFFGVVVQNLDFGADIGRVAFQWSTDAQAIVGPRRELELEAEDKVSVLVFGVKVSAAAAFRVDDQVAALDVVVGFITDPLIDVAAVEECLVARLFFGGGGVGLTVFYAGHHQKQT